jgi:hypothetical protein
MNENEVKAWDWICETLRVMKLAKPEDRTERARAHAVAVTEMEKVAAYYKAYIVDVKNG